MHSNFFIQGIIIYYKIKIAANFFVDFFRLGVVKVLMSFIFFLADDVLIYKSSGTHRVLPPTLTNGKSVDNPLLVGTSDPEHRPSLGDQRFTEHDERAIYQEVLLVFSRGASVAIDLIFGSNDIHSHSSKTLLRLTLFGYSSLFIAYSLKSKLG